MARCWKHLIIAAFLVATYPLTLGHFTPVQNDGKILVVEIGPINLYPCVVHSNMCTALINPTIALAYGGFCFYAQETPGARSCTYFRELKVNAPKRRAVRK